MADDALEFTGERFTPECVREIWYEHWHRYAFARRLVGGLRVLDAACGEGYGTAMLAPIAREVVGVDVDATAIAHASRRYARHANARFEQLDATQLPFADASFDVVVSFETLEHVRAQEALIAGFARVLADNGVLIVSSPDKLTYSDLAGFRNEYHERELYRDELLELLDPHFPHVRLYGQKLAFHSMLWAIDGTADTVETLTASAHDGLVATSIQHAPMYYVAVCAKQSHAIELPTLSIFGDREESVYAHYNEEIRKNMGAGEHIARLESELAALRSESDTTPVSAQQQVLPAKQRWWERKR